MTSVRRRPGSWLVFIVTLLVAWPPALTPALARADQATAKPAPATQKPAAPAAPASPAAPAAPAVPAAPAAANAVPDGGWPRYYDVDGGGTATLYQPQIATWENQKHMIAWSAVSFERKDLKQPALGTIKIEANTKVALDDRLVNFEDFTIAESNFSSLSRDQTRELLAGLQKGVPTTERVIALDRVLAAVDKSAIRPKETPGVKADPPRVFSSTRPAVLVGFDGDPIWSPIKDVDLRYAVNTNWDVFEVGAAKTLYLRNNDNWFKATDLKGPWEPAGTLPQSFRNLPADDNWKDVKAAVPGKSISAKAMPTIFVASEPAELLVLTGEPSYVLVPGTDLLWVNNTESDLFRLGKTGAFYYLVAGRWFSSPGLDGPWTFATPTLPADFQKISVEHPRSRVLASVPGTEQANEAVLLAEIPHTARVDAKQLKAPEVKYAGDPKFEPISETTVARAVNTDKDVIKVGDLYYMCFQAVWFMSRTPTGPWEVAKTVPKEIYTIPASSPAHSVTYVTVQEDDNSNDEWVTFAYVAAYTGMAVAWGCAVWGTGWYYPPYIGYGGFYPFYYPYPRTYGMGAWYNPYTGGFGRGAAVYGPYGGAGMGAVYNPISGTYARGAAAYGPYGSRSVGQAYNPRTGAYGATRQGSNIYGNWGSSYVQRGDDWARTAHVNNYARGTSTRAARTDEGSAVTRRGQTGRTTVARGDNGDVYAGHNGNVYRRDDGGNWQSWNDGSWGAADRPERTGQADAGTRDTNTAGQLNRDAAARQTGATRTRDYGSYRSAPTRQGAGSYRGGGGARGGGGRRR
jgi:hypothetical protein